jgi:vacuolar-type H+-ATPase subunit E/Vma4
MSLDSIRKSILSESQAKARAIDSEAEASSRKIIQEADSEAERLIKAAEDEARREAERILREGVAGAQVEASSKVIEAKSRVLQNELESVMSNLAKIISEKHMKDVLHEAMKQYASTGEDPKSAVIASSRENEHIAKSAGVKHEVADISGFTIRNKDGSVTLDATVESVISKVKEDALRLIDADLFGKPAEPERRKAATKRKPAKRGKR